MDSKSKRLAGDDDGSIPQNGGVLVIGMGRFGSRLALTVERLGREVLAVEKNPDVINRWSGRIPLVEADAADPDALEQLGAREYPVAVVGVGTELESSVLVTSNLVDLGTCQVWAKATSPEHARILRRIGANHVILPETDAADRVAHLVGGRLLDYIEFEDGFTIVKMRPPKETIGFTLGELGIRKKYGVQVIGVKTPGKEFEYGTDETRIARGDLLIVSGNTALLERFASRP
ncbi:MAG: TrkA family potassium uptake protein [Bifidobacteriaceae bacterium]|jgi:trk system potassium uptake protein TrkA|nr:TrkA family potassium uptake protein [Bifidobacteriaceae bacterium]